MPRHQQIFTVGDWTVEPDLLEVRRGADRQRLEPKVMALLVCLADRAPNVVSRDEILEEVWEGRSVVDETVTRAVSLLRQAFGDTVRKPRYIETIPTKGYRLLALVTAAEPSDTAQANAVSEEPANPGPSREPRRGVPILLMAALMTLALLAAGLVWIAWPRDREAPVGAEGPTAERAAIAVLPFTSSQDDVMLAIGLSDELIHLLSRMENLRVVSRTSSMRFRDSAQPVAEVAHALGVDYVLEGSVMASNGRVRIHAQLVRPADEETLLSRRYERPLVDVLALQRDVARDVAREIRVPLISEERLRSGAEGRVDPEAYRLFLRASSLLKDRGDVGLAVSLFERSVDLDPEFSLAWAGLAEAELLTVQYLSDPQGHERAARAIETALVLDERLAQAHAARGLLFLSRDQDWDESERSFQRAIDLEASYSTAYQWYSEMLSLVGRHDEAVETVEIAMSLDPLSPLVRAAAGQRMGAARRYEDAAEQLLAAEDLGARFGWHLRELALVRNRLGDEAGAVNARRQELSRTGLSEAQFDAFEAAVQEAGLEGFWRWYRSYLEATDDRFAMRRAEAAAALGLDEEALAWLEVALDGPVMWFLHTQRSPAFDDLRQDERYLEMVAGYPLWSPTR